MQPEDPNPGLERARFQLRADGVPAETPNRLRSGIHSRGYLPHVKREGASYFVTFRLADSLPKEVLLRFLGEKAERLRALELRKRQRSTKAQAGKPEETAEENNRSLSQFALGWGMHSTVRGIRHTYDVIEGIKTFSTK